jgi:hypothetical protein
VAAIHARGIKKASVLLCLLWLGLAAAQTPSEILADYQSMDLAGRLRQGGPRFDLVISCVPFRLSRASRGALRSGQFLGTDGREPQCVVETFLLKLNGTAVDIPIRSYSDLADVALPRGVYLTGERSLVVVHVQGGDGAGAYKARFMIEGHHLVSREVEQLDESGEVKIVRKKF